MHEHGDGRGGHPWWMMALCALPLVALLLVTVFQVPLSSVLIVGMVLLCPLSHLLMGGHGAHRRDDSTEVGPSGGAR